MEFCQLPPICINPPTFSPELTKCVFPFRKTFLPVIVISPLLIEEVFNFELSIFTEPFGESKYNFSSATILVPEISILDKLLLAPLIIVLLIKLGSELKSFRWYLLSLKTLKIFPENRSESEVEKFKFFALTKFAPFSIFNPYGETQKRLALFSNFIGLFIKVPLLEETPTIIFFCFLLKKLTSLISPLVSKE